MHAVDQGPHYTCRCTGGWLESRPAGFPNRAQLGRRGRWRLTNGGRHCASLSIRDNDCTCTTWPPNIALHTGAVWGRCTARLGCGAMRRAKDVVATVVWPRSGGDGRVDERVAERQTGAAATATTTTERQCLPHVFADMWRHGDRRRACA